MRSFSFLVVATIIFGVVFMSCNKNDDKLNDDKLNEFTVLFNCNGGSDVPSQTVKGGEKAIKPNNPTHDEYTFVAWFKEVELTNEWNFNTDVVNSDITLYAKWIEEAIEEDPMYPTTIYRLSEEILLEMRNDFAQRNPDVYTTLNHFGFCAIASGGRNGTPGGFTKEEAIAAVKEFVARNPEYTGVSNPNDLQFKSITSTVGYNDVLFWYFYAENQIINNMEVDYSGINFYTQSEKLVSCYGNHFPEVYVPEKFNFSVEKAKSQLLGKEVIHLGWTGPYSEGIVTEDLLQQSITELIIVPLKTDEKIELRVAWKIFISSLHHIFEIDVMTGEIIREKPTIIA
jgi:uncharacterized repeat protein (TIGR02543 family)